MLTKWYNNPLFYHQNRFSGDDERWIRPMSNILESDDEYRIELSVPGFQKKEIKISVDKSVLTIQSERDYTKDEKLSYNRREFGGFNFRRSFTIPETVNVDTIAAEYKNGVLALNLPKKEEVKIKKEISIS